jgi:AcrR family transcriptional regulator
MAEGATGAAAAERLAATRTRLLEAVVESLAERGYAATSTNEVARRSGLTRGAQLHHFGTKDQMVLAAVGHLVARSSVDDVVAALDALPAGQDRLATVVDVLSTLFVGQVPAAYVELWAASRTDPALTEALRDADEVARAAVRALFGEEILARAGEEFDALLDLTLYALRGMALDARLEDGAEIDARRALVRGMTPYLRRALRAPGESDPTKH